MDQWLKAGAEAAPCPPVIRTARLVLQRLRADHAPAMFAYRREEAVQRFQNFRPRNLEEVTDFLTRHTRDFNRTDNWYQLGVFRRDRLIGDLGIHFLAPDNQQCEIGYTIGPSDQRQGYGREAVAGLIGFLFGSLHKHRLVASLDPQNTASIALVESLGFRREGLFRQSVWNGGQWVDDLVYAVLREEWPGCPKPGEGQFLLEAGPDAVVW